MFYNFDKDFCNSAAGKERLRFLFSLSSSVLLCGALLISLGVAGCGRAALKDGVYSCVEGEEDTCPPGWICRRDSDGDYRCFSTDGQGDGGVDGGEDANLNDGGDVDGGCDCADVDMPCCDGCNFLPRDHRCDDTPVGIERACSEPACGTTIIEALSYKHCSGSSAECDSSNIRGVGEWEDVEWCAPSEACREAGEGDAYCEPCPKGCQQNECCVDNDSDGFYANCVTYDCDDDNSSVYPEATEICANCVDEDCSGSDQPCDPTASITFTPTHPSAHSLVEVLVTANPGHACVWLEIEGPDTNEQMGDPIISGGPPYTWTWEVMLNGAGDYRFKFTANNHSPCEITHDDIICHQLKVN